MHPPAGVSFTDGGPCQPGGSLGADPDCTFVRPACSFFVAMVMLCSPIWHLGVDLAAQGPGGTRRRRPSSRDSWMWLSSGVGCGVSAPLGLLAKGLDLAAESIEREFVFRLYSLRWCWLMGISGEGNSWLCPRRISPDASLHPGPATSGHRREELASCGAGVVGRGSAFGPGRALWETLISLTLTRAPHGITSKSQDKPSRQPESLLLGRDEGHLAPPNFHLQGSTQAAPSPPALLRSLPATRTLSKFPYHPGASQDQRISSGPQQRQD